MLWRSFRLGRQEDAHEYLVALLDAMHESLLEGFKPKPAPSVAETSMIFRIFAGKIRSQVCLLPPCLDCFQLYHRPVHQTRRPQNKGHIDAGSKYLLITDPTAPNVTALSTSPACVSVR